MSFVYVLSVVYIMSSFLLYRKKKDKISVITSIVYGGCLLFCYNILIAWVGSFLNVGGSLISYSIINVIIGTLINFISFRRKKIQKYYFDKKEFYSCLVIILLVFLIGCFRFRGFDAISYETSDPAVHYRYALSFNDNLEILDKNNSKDLVYGNFSGAMIIHYVNCGFMMKILNSVPTYQVFIFFDVVCLVLSSLLFLVTISNLLPKKNYWYVLGLSLIYLLGFPLNNLVFGFSYLGLGIMVINLLFFTIIKIDKYKEDVISKLIILFMLSFSVFFSYYLFVPIIYFILGIYYIYLWRKKRISIKELLLYGFCTLVFPFILGLVKFVMPGFRSGGTSIITAAGIDGYIYSNDSIGYFFVILSIIYFIRVIKKNKKLTHFDYWFGNVTAYVLLFYLLRMFGVVSTYYFYKLFYLYWFFAIVFVGNLLREKKHFLYVALCFVVVAMGVVLLVPDNLFSKFLVKSNIFSWNINTFSDKKIILTKEELELINESIKYEDKCVENNEFLISGYGIKNLWYYAMTGNVPLYGFEYDKPYQLGEHNITLDFWKDLNNYKCLIYFYEDDKKEIDKDKLDILFDNEEGAILIKKEEE